MPCPYLCSMNSKSRVRTCHSHAIVKDPWWVFCIGTCNCVSFPVPWWFLWIKTCTIKRPSFPFVGHMLGQHHVVHSKKNTSLDDFENFAKDMELKGELSQQTVGTFVKIPPVERSGIPCRLRGWCGRWPFKPHGVGQSQLGPKMWPNSTMTWQRRKKHEQWKKPWLFSVYRLGLPPTH